MKSISFALLFTLWFGTSTGQTLTGKVVDSSTGEALAYVNIGGVGQPRGTITDETGTFALEINGLPAEVTVRFSMIGYAAQTFTIKDLSESDVNTIQLENISVPLSEVVIKPKKQRKIGTTGCDPGNVCGWGGDYFGKGYEIGLNMELGESPVLIKSLHVRVHKLSFDSCKLRLHVRNLVNDLPGNELLTQNIYVSITKTGWVEIDLSKYQLSLQGDVILSLEWVDVKGINKNKYVSIRSNGQKLPSTSVILFNSSKNKGSTYIRWGSEAKWQQTDGSPSFYLTVK
jgi:hypothetical protein